LQERLLALERDVERQEEQEKMMLKQKLKQIDDAENVNNRPINEASLVHVAIITLIALFLSSFCIDD
jgi:hypothetical protein